MQCPVCDDVQLSISSREGVEIDYCPQCRGVWLDRGELDKIIDRAAPGGSVTAPAPARARRDDDDRYRRDDDRYDDRYGGKRRKRRGGFLEDLFDFD